MQSRKNGSGIAEAESAVGSKKLQMRNFLRIYEGADAVCLGAEAKGSADARIFFAPAFAQERSLFRRCKWWVSSASPQKWNCWSQRAGLQCFSVDSS